MLIGVYKIECNNKIYIGSSVNILNRWTNHKSNLKNNKHPNAYLQNLYNKYGKDKFIYSIIEECRKEEILVKEQYYIDTLKPVINLRVIAESNKGIKMSDFTKQKLREKATGRTSSDEVKKNLSDLKKQEYYINIAKNNLPKNTKGENNPRTKMKNYQIIEVINLINKGYKNKEISNLYPISTSAITELKAGRSWKQYFHLLNK